MQLIKTGTTYHLRRRAAHRKAVTAVTTLPWVQHTKWFSACSLKRSCHSETAGSEKHTARDGHGPGHIGRNTPMGLSSFLVKPPLELPLFPGPGPIFLFQRPGRLAGCNTPARATTGAARQRSPSLKPRTIVLEGLLKRRAKDATDRAVHLMNRFEASYY